MYSGGIPSSEAVRTRTLLRLALMLARKLLADFRDLFTQRAHSLLIVGRELDAVSVIVAEHIGEESSAFAFEVLVLVRVRAKDRCEIRVEPERRSKALDARRTRLCRFAHHGVGVRDLHETGRNPTRC